VIGGGTYGPFAMLLKKNGVDPAKDIKLVEVGFAVSEDALRSGAGRCRDMNQPFAARAEDQGRHAQAVFALRGNAEHRSYS